MTDTPTPPLVADGTVRQIEQAAELARGYHADASALVAMRDILEDCTKRVQRRINSTT